MEVLRGTIREVVGVLPDDASIVLAVPVRYAVGSNEQIFDVVVKLAEPVVDPAPKPTSRTTTKSAPRRPTTKSAPQSRRSTPQA